MVDRRVTLDYFSFFIQFYLFLFKAMRGFLDSLTLCICKVADCGLLSCQAKMK